MDVTRMTRLAHWKLYTLAENYPEYMDIYNELDAINRLRNRIAHHEPICFNKATGAIDTSYALTMYARIMTLFQWMGIDSGSLLFGLDHVGQVCNKIMCL